MLTIDIWSDIACPFCYIGKRNLENALAQFPELKPVITYHSFQLSPDMVTTPGISLNEYLARHKGISIVQAQQMNENVSRMAAEAGLDYHMEKTIPANSFNAHRLLHFAKEKGKQSELKEALLHGYFSEGKNIDDHQTLIDMATQVGLHTQEAERWLSEGSGFSEVKKDLEDAVRYGINAVPCFVFNMEYAVSGAQPVATFSQLLHQLA